MRRVIQLSLLAVILSGGALLYGCGSSNNDQGVSFTALGYNSMDEDLKCDPETFITGMSIPISAGTTEETLANAGQAIYSCINLQNNMSTQFVRVERVFHEFFIEGASIQPPTSSAPVSIVVGPAAGASGTPTAGGSSLPQGFEAANNVSAPFIAVPAEVMEWIVLNRNVLPEPPFTMGVTHYVTGITSAGDRLNTNKLTMFVVVTPDVIIPPEEVVDTEATPEAEDETTTEE